MAEAFINASPTGGSCLDRYSTFIEGKGIANEELGAMVVNPAGETWNDIHHLCAESFAKFNGFALHVSYNAMADISAIRVMPFEDLRLYEPDSYGYVGAIAYHPDWSEEATRAGKRLKVSADTIETFDIYNPDKNVVLAQIQGAGGIEFYKGQVLYITNKGRNVYPLPIYDKVLNELSVDEGISNVKNRNVKNNFLPAGMVIHKGSHPNNYAELNAEARRAIDRGEAGFSDALASLQGDTNACSLLEVTIDYEDEKPEFVPIQVANYDKVFESTEASTTERIYACFGQEAFYCLRIGKIGFSGSLIADAKREYAEQQVKRQKLLAQTYNEVLKHFAPSIIAPGALIELIPYVDITTPLTE